MKKLFCLLLLALPMTFFHPLEGGTGLFDGFKDLYVSFSKRNRDIKNTIIDSISTWKKKWKEEEMAVPRDTYMSFAFIPENQEPYGWSIFNNYYERERFTYTEYDLQKHCRDIHDMPSFMREVLSEKEDRDSIYIKNIVSQNGSEIKFFSQVKPKPVEIKNCLKDGTIETKTQIHPEYAGRYTICKAINTGNFKFRVYKYETANRNISLEEREFWFQMFDYTKIEF